MRTIRARTIAPSHGEVANACCRKQVPGLFAAFMTTADAAVEGREAITAATSLPRSAPRSRAGRRPPQDWIKSLASCPCSGRWRGAEPAPGGICLHHHHADVMRHHVVQFAGDKGTFVPDRLPGEIWQNRDHAYNTAGARTAYRPRWLPTMRARLRVAQ